MELSSRRRVFYIILSLFVSIFIWVFSNHGVPVSISVRNVPVEFLNEHTTLAEKGFMLGSGADQTVDLALTANRNVIAHMDTDQIRVVVDLSQVNSVGMQSVSYSVSFPSNISASAVSIESPTVRMLTVGIQELFRKEVEIRCRVVGNVAEGYLAGAVDISPKTLEIRGHQADVIRVSYAQVTLNIDNATSTIVELLDYELYGFDDKPLDSSQLHPATQNIQVTMPVMVVKEIPLAVQFVEAAGARQQDIAYKIEPSSVVVSGDSSVLSSVDTILLGRISLEEIGTRKEFSYEIPLPSSAQNLGEATKATLTILSKNFSTKSYTIKNIGYENLRSDRPVTIVTPSVTVQLRGNTKLLGEITAEDISVVAALGDITDASGTYTVPARIDISKAGQALDVGAIGSYQVIVQLGSDESNVPPQPDDETSQEGGKPDSDLPAGPTNGITDADVSSETANKTEVSGKKEDSETKENTDDNAQTSGETKQTSKKQSGDGT